MLIIHLKKVVYSSIFQYFKTSIFTITSTLYIPHSGRLLPRCSSSGNSYSSFNTLLNFFSLPMQVCQGALCRNVHSRFLTNKFLALLYFQWYIIYMLVSPSRLRILSRKKCNFVHFYVLFRSKHEGTWDIAGIKWKQWEEMTEAMHTVPEQI